MSHDAESASGGAHMDAPQRLPWWKVRRGCLVAIEWLGRRETLEAFAATVRPGRPRRVDLAPFGSRQWFTIALDEAGAVRAVSPIGGHAD